MADKVSRNRHLGFVSLFVTILIVLLATTVLAQPAARTPARRSSTEKASPAAQNSGNPLFCRSSHTTPGVIPRLSRSQM